MSEAWTFSLKTGTMKHLSATLFILSFLSVHASIRAQDDKGIPLRTLYERECFEEILSLADKGQERATPSRSYWIGKASKRTGDYRSAIKSFKRVSKGKYAERARSEEKACRKAMEWKRDPICVVEPLDRVNTERDESCPAWGDSTYTTLLFTRTSAEKDPRNEEMMVTDKLEDGHWKQGEAFQEDLNSEAHELSLSIDRDEGKGYFSRCKDQRCEIRRLARTEARWRDEGTFELLQPCAPDSVNLTHPAYDPARERLYFSSDMPGGEGGYDIWYIEVDSVGGGWSDPVNAGSDVNSEGDEIFPSVRSDGRLYFSSDGIAGMGGMDIFRAERNGIGGFEAVKNLGYPINSEGNDTKIIFEGRRMRGIFSSDRDSDPCDGKDDLYRFFKKT